MPEGLALVTGASSGIGYWLAEELGSRGYDLVVSSAGKRLNDAVRDFDSLGVKVTQVSADSGNARWREAIVGCCGAHRPPGGHCLC